MLTLRLDESIDHSEGDVVLAGFLGKPSAWIRCGRKWRKELGVRKTIHMKELRGWNDDRNKDLLERLGRVPASCGLTLVYCSLRVSDYEDLITGTLVELGNVGYINALRTLVVVTIRDLPYGEKLEVICEDQKAFAARREYTFRTLAAMPEYQNQHGFSRLAKWSSVPKNSLLEPCDYAAYALLQRIRDPASRKALLCSPILKCKTLALPLSRAHSRDLFITMRSHIPHAFEPSDKDQNRRFHKVLAKLMEADLT